MAEDVIKFTVAPNAAGNWIVMEDGFEKSLAEFPDPGTAEQYALRLAESRLSWRVDVFDASGSLTVTFNSEDDAMPKPGVV